MTPRYYNVIKGPPEELYKHIGEVRGLTITETRRVGESMRRLVKYDDVKQMAIFNNNPVLILVDNDIFARSTIKMLEKSLKIEFEEVN